MFLKAWALRKPVHIANQSSQINPICVQSHTGHSREARGLRQMDLWRPVPAVAAKSTGALEHAFLCNVWGSALCPLIIPQKTSKQTKQDQGVTQHLHEQVPDKTNKIYSLNSHQVFTACLPRPGTVLGPEDTMATKADKRPSLMELAFK